MLRVVEIPSLGKFPGFLVSCFCWFPGVLASWLLAYWLIVCLVSWFLGSLVSKFQRFKDSQIPLHLL